MNKKPLLEIPKKKKSNSKKKQLLAKGEWSNLNLNYKHEIILEWNLNGGVVSGKRITRKDLAKELGMSLNEVIRQLEKIQAANASLFEKRPQARAKILNVVHNLMNQLQDDRARTVLHAEILEKELTKVQNKITEIEKWPELTSTDRDQKRLEIARWLQHFRSISYHKIDSLRTLFESTDAITKFLQLFASGKGAGKGEGIKGFLEAEGEEEDKPQIVGYKEAVLILGDTQGQILPSQNHSTTGPRSPTAGFESFKNPSGRSD